MRNARFLLASLRVSHSIKFAFNHRDGNITGSGARIVAPSHNLSQSCHNRSVQARITHWLVLIKDVATEIFSPLKPMRLQKN